MAELDERVRIVVQRFGSVKVAEVCGISELMLLRVGAGITGKPGVLVRLAEALPRLEGDGWAQEITSTRKVATAAPTAPVLTEREVAIRDAITADSLLREIVRDADATARDLLRAGPGVNVVGNVQDAGTWLRENPERMKKNGAAFLLRWVRRSQEKIGLTLVPPPRGGVYGRVGPVQPAVAPAVRRWGMASCAAPGSGVLPTAAAKKMG